MSQAWNCSVQVDATQTSEAEIPQECPHRCNQVFCSTRATLIGPIEQELPDSACIPFADILTEDVEHLGGVAAVMSEGWLSCATMLSKPIPERHCQYGLNNPQSHGEIAFANSRFEQIRLKAFRAENYMMIHFAAV